MPLFPEVSINYLAVFATGFVNMLIGMTWYSSRLFGKRWADHLGIPHPKIFKPDSMVDHIKRSYLGSFVCAMVMSYVLAMVIGFTESDTALRGAAVGLLMWLGFVMPSSLTDYLFARRSRELYFINYTYELIALMAMGAVLALWR